MGVSRRMAIECIINYANTEYSLSVSNSDTYAIIWLFLGAHHTSHFRFFAQPVTVEVKRKCHRYQKNGQSCKKTATALNR